MKKITFLLTLMLLTLGIGNAWGAEQTVKWTATSGALGNGIGSGTIKTGTYAWNYTRTLISGTSYTGWSSSCIQLGKNGGVENITFTTSAIPGTIKSVAVECSSYNNAHKVSIAVGGTTYLAATATAKWTTVGTKTGTGSSTGTINISFTGGTRALYIKSITVVYEETSSGGDEPVASLSAAPTTIDFGTVYEGATVADKTVAVNFANLTGAVTYSGLSTPFSATGAISATGDKITISADASTIGEYSQTLTVASTADSKTAEVTVKINVVEKPAPTGTFTLHTGELVEGDYVIYYSGKAMKAEVASNRLQYVEVTPSNNEIVDPAAAAIWHIAPSGDNWTIYNDNKGYAAGNGTKSQAQLVANLTGDNANKAAWTVTGTSTYEFTNVWNTSKSVNAALRNNGTYGFACYATSTGGALSLYRKAGEKYDVTVNSTTNGTVTADPTSAEAGTTITLTVTPDGGYVLDALTVTDASSNPVIVTNNEFTMPASNVTVTATFKENEKPAATLTLSKNGETEDITGHKQGDKVELPSITSDCVKEFVGWSANPTCNVAPEYKAGDEYTLAATSQTLYAVYATVEGGEATASVDMATYANDNSWGSSSSTNQKEININSDLKAVISEGGNSGKYYNDGVRIYQTEDATVTVSTTAGELKSVKFTFTNSNTGTLLYNSTALTSGTAVEVTGTSATFSVGNSGSATNGQVRFTAIEVVYTGNVTYSNYSTTCSAALANPTFSLAAGKYTEAKSVEITATEGTVYYTTDGTPPTASSTQYTGAIALNDCGEYTIKAIAISADSQSDVVSATYTIKLPLTNSQAAPYTEAEAIAVYDGDCYDNQDVYVKGTVKTATFYNSGTYTITLTNGFQFYKFYKDGSKATFTDGEINIGDVLVACGKLSKHNTTYQLAEGCYLVEHTPYEGEKTDISNTEATAYTVDQAFALIADVSSDLTKEVYVKGLVAVAPTSNPTADGQMTYKISDNGENTGNVLTVYLGLNLNGEKFTSKNDVQQGDYVVVKGKLLDYNSTYELNKGNQLVQHVKAATISIADITMEVGETKTIAATVVPAEAEVTYTIKENEASAISLSGNTITALAEGTATITAIVAEGATYLSNSVDFTVTVTPQNIATLPFAFDGGVNDIKNTLGMSHKNLGTDYSSSPKLKFDDKDDYVIIHFDERPGILSYDIKANTGSGAFSGEFAVQESADGVTYRDLVKYSTISGSKETKTHNCFDKDTRYIKFILATKDNGNVALGNIKIETSVVTKVTPTIVENSYFSVGNNKYVQFSTGNLQYEVGTNTWSFASEQYEVVGGATYDPANPTNTNYGMNEPGYTGKLDLFGWSSDGKFGVNPSNKDADYGTDGVNEFVDWGELVNETGWYTLTKEEMNHILARTKDGKKLWALATVCGMNGLILLPDNWNTSITLDYGYVPANFNYTKNQINDATWQTLEAAGAVFLPEGGTRVGGHDNKEQGGGPDEFDAHGDYFHVDNVGEMGYYWLNTQDSRDTHKNCASFLILPGWSEGPTDADNDDVAHSPQVWSREKRRGNSVRLVKAVEPVYTRNGQTSGAYGTVCYRENIVWVDGATLYEVAGKEGNKVIFDEVTTPEAGMPYIFIAEKETINFICGTEYEEGTAGKHNSLQGTFTKIEPAVDNILVDNYMLVNNIIKKCGINCGLYANRAYFVATELEGLDAPQSQMPGRRRISLNVTSENTTTGLDNITNGENTTIKVFENGQLIIIRNGEKFNVQGQKL